MKKNLLLLNFLYFIFNTVSANHVNGGELTYTYIGNGSYSMTFTFYRDCSGVPAPLTFNLDIDNTCGFSSQMITLNSTGNYTELTRPCSGVSTQCNGGTARGIQKYVYTGVVTLATQCDQWLFSVKRCCRASDITNLVAPANYELYIEAKLNNLVDWNNSSPSFTNEPVFFNCLNQPTVITPNISETDGDYIICSMIGPKYAANQAVPYKNGFTIDQPVSSSPAVTFAAKSGNITLKPTTAEVVPLVILVSEYRNGVLIGEVERDYQFHAVVCNNVSPFVSGINGSNDYSITICANVQTCFNIQTIDANVNDHTILTEYSGINGATLTTHNGNRMSGDFCWTPALNDVSITPYQFSVYVNDDNCAYEAQQIFTYHITVIEPDLNCLQTGINNINADNGISVYPQPANGQLTINFSGSAFDKLHTVEIKNILGETVYLNHVSKQMVLDLGKEQNGIYFVCVSNPSGQIISKEKFVIQH